jgi:hypothetical protein
MNTNEEGMHMKAFKIRNFFLLMTLLLSGYVNAETSDISSEMTNKTTSELVDSVSPVKKVEIKEAAPVSLSVEDLKKKVIELNRDLFILEEDLLFPANTQFAVFVSLDSGKFLQLDSMKLEVDGEIVAAHLYTLRQVKSLQRGGMQRLYIGNLKTGEHEVTAFVDGIGPDNSAYKQAMSLSIMKDTDIKSIEIKITDQSSNFEPRIEIVEWD